MRWPGVLLWMCGLVMTLGGADESHLTTDDEGYLTVIQGFATQLQCVLNTCSPNVVWYKDESLLFNGTQFNTASNLDEKAYKLQHKVEVDLEKGCLGSCSASEPCENGQACVDNQCCHCAQEHYTLVLRNLTFDDSGRYKCQIANKTEQLEFQVEVLESGLRGGFHENISYDHSECCQDKGISPLCRAMCKPSEMDQYHFDPTSCKTDDYKNFLSCATDNGTRSHVHCCKTQLVPSFCYDFCSGNFSMLRRSHRLCLYYLPEIFECYNRAYLPYPDPPEDVIVNAVEHDKLQVCWEKPQVHDSNIDYPVSGYTVSYKEVPNFPLLGGEIGIPLLTGDYTDIGDVDDYSNDEEEESTTAPITKRDTVKLSETSEVHVVKKRSTILMVTRDSDSNTTSVREFAFKHVNTTDTCATLSDLRAATRYIVYVTARNDYGTSVPSVRSIASTNAHIISNNESIPDTMECCRRNNVSAHCLDKMCSVDSIPSTLSTISIATTCRSEWSKVSPCVADQRNHTDCCLRKQVQKECLPICAGSTETLGVHSVLCLNLDIHAIYQCLREGYESRPSAPVNVSVHEVTSSSAEFHWEEPASNAHLVETFTLFIRKKEHAAIVRQVYNAISPHTELGLDPDSEYVVAVQANARDGSSLPSTELLFYTKPDMFTICPIGEPLLVSEGRAFLCNQMNPCPNGFQCTEAQDEAYCCQIASHSDATFQECCLDQSVAEDCMPSCYYNATLPEACIGDLTKWIQCGSQGRDHSRCCDQAGVPHECQAACRHPFQVADSCYSSIDLLSKCFSGANYGKPGTVRNVQASEINSSSAKLSWDAQNHHPQYTVQVYQEKNGELFNSWNTTETEKVVDGLTPETKYLTRVIAFNAKGASSPSWNLTFITSSASDGSSNRPRAPEGLRVSWNEGARVNVSWSAVTVNEDGSAVKDVVVYTLYFVDAEKSTNWNQMHTNNTWAVMSELRRDALYSVYVTAQQGGKTSRSSSVITLIAQPDSMGLPEPQIELLPDKANGQYGQNEHLKINCSFEDPENDKHYNMDLSVGTVTKSNDPGLPWVSVEIDTDSTTDSVTCAVTDTDGRQNVAMRNLRVQFGPVASFEHNKTRVFDDDSADIKCVVKGQPAPNIRFEKEGRPADGRLSVGMSGINTYTATLHVAKARGKEGVYTCIAESGENVSQAKTELIISSDTLDKDPRQFSRCCEKEKVSEECLPACSLGAVSEGTNCTQSGPAILKCADDLKDHTDCCVANRVPRKCIPLCAGDSYDATMGCEEFAVSIMGCFIKGHERSPEAVANPKAQHISQGKLRIWWDDSTTQNTYYAVYYKPRYTDEDYKIVKSNEPSVTVEVIPGEEYDVGVTAVNAFGTSPLVFLDISPDDSSSTVARKTSGGRSAAWYITFILLFCVLLFLVFIVVVRRRDLPAPFGKFIGRRQVPDNHPSVAFENPAYVTGNEVEIRGLGTQWQPQDLQAGASGDREANNGNKYAKLETA